MTAPATRWRPSTPGSIAATNTGVVRLQENSVARLQQDGTARILEDNVLTPKEATTWVAS